MATVIGVAMGRLRFNLAPLVRELLSGVESAGGLDWLGEIVRSSPR